MSNNKDVKRGIVLYIDGKQVKSDVTSIQAELRKLKKELTHMEIGSREYQNQMAKIRNLNTILKEHRANVRAVNEETRKSALSFGKFVDGFNRFGGFIASALATLTGFVLGIRALRDDLNKLETSQHSLKALTGLDDESISWLTEQAKQLSTTMTEEGLRVRQSADEILDAFMLVGSAKPELLGNKEALAAVTEEAMRLQAAAGDITLNEAVDSLTLSLNQYGDAADQAARYANVLAAGSQAGSANIASQAKAIRNAGTAAASANVPIEQTVALIETLAYKGIKDEVAGTGLKKFFLVLQTGARETNPAIVGLDKALENLKNKNMDASAIKKMFGEEGYNTASVILQNTGMVKDFTAAVTGTSLATEQAAINSDTAAAKLDQARNKMKLAGIELAEKLNPALTVSTNAMTYVVKILPGLIDWFREWGTEVVIVGGAILLYSTRTRIATAATSAWSAVTKVATVIQLAYGAAMNTVNGYTVTSIGQLRKLSVLMQGHTVLMKALRASTYAAAGVMQLFRGRVDLAGKAFKALGGVLAKNPWGMVATGILAAASALLIYNKRNSLAKQRQKELHDINTKANESISEERNQLNALRAVLEDSTQSYASRKSALKKIQEIVPDYHASLTTEGKLINNNSDALDGYVEKLLVTAKQQAANAKLQEALADRSQWIKDNEDYNMKFKTLEWDIKAPENFGKSAEELAAKSGLSITAYNAWSSQKKQLDENVKYYEGMMANYTKELMAIDAKYAKKKVNPDNPNPDKKGGSESEEERKKRVAKELEEIEAEHFEKLEQLKRDYIADDSMTTEAYNKRVTESELDTLDKKLKVMGIEESKRREFSNKILDIQMKQRNDRVDKLNEETKTILTAQQKRFQLELAEEIKAFKDKQTTREEFLKALDELYKKYSNAPEIPKIITDKQKKELDEYIKKLEELINVQKDSSVATEEWKVTVKNSWNDAEKWAEMSFDDISAVLGKTIQYIYKLGDAFWESQDSLQAFSQFAGAYLTQFGMALGQTLGGAKDSLSDFLKESLVMVLDTIKKVLIAKQAAAIAEVTMKDVTRYGLLGIVKAAGKIALISAAFEAAKTAIGNFYTGGYTDDGPWDKPQGIVHSNEFVANRFAVANPQVRPVLDLIDAAQRSGSVANLTGADIAAVAGVPVQTVMTQPQVVQVRQPQASAQSDRVLKQLTQALNALYDKLDEPIPVYNQIAGSNGLRRKLDRYDILMNNKSRKKTKK